MKKKSVLFVCLGNICRSPTAEAVLRKKAKEMGLNLEIDSAGTRGYHAGCPPDKRAQMAGESRGYSFKGIKCRRVIDKDFEKFDYILAMDEDNLRSLKESSDPEYHSKIHLFMDFSASDETEVPDPYYGGKKGFDVVLDLIEVASDGFLKQLG
jgi:protein-tyrosine phosphatase